MKSINDTKKSKKGRPPVDTEAVNLRLPRDTLDAVEDMRRQLEKIPSRPEAIRQLIDQALAMAKIRDEIDEYRHQFTPPLSRAEAIRHALKQAAGVLTATPMLKDMLSGNQQVVLKVSGLDLDSEPERD
jgi:hypothetical protein